MGNGEKISTLRKKSGMTQADLGTALNVTFQAVSKWERNESFPDFETMSRMAKLFKVPLNYFEEGGENIAEETAATRQAAAEVDEDDDYVVREMAGVCKECGRVIYAGDEGEKSPALMCKSCVKERKVQKQIEADKEKKRAAIKAKKLQLAIDKQRNRGLIWSTVICSIILVISIVTLFTSENADIGAQILGTVIALVFLFPYITQLFWDGFIRDVTLKGGAIIGTPGVIFTLDLDGIIFLIVVKILFAVLRFIIYMIGLLFFVAVAILFAPFAFIPELKKCNRGELLED